MVQTLYTRSSDGCDPVYIQREGNKTIYTLDRPSGRLVCKSARQLLIALTGHPDGRHWTLERYFRTGKYAVPDRDDRNPILEACGPSGWAVSEGGALYTRTGPVLVQGQRSGRGTGRSDGLGIDLNKRGREVAKLLYAGFSGLIRSGGYDPNDVLQEVYKGILIRNAGRCPFDASKASFGHYVHMICHCVLSNYHRKSQRYKSGLVDGVYGYDDDGDKELMDVGDDRALTVSGGGVCCDPLDDSDWLTIEGMASVLGSNPHRELAIRVMPLMRMGYTRTEIAEQLGESKSNITRACSFLRKELREHREAFV